MESSGWFLAIVGTAIGALMRHSMQGHMSPIRLCSVTGHQARINDVVFCPAAQPSDVQSTIVYFGGDVQDFPEMMASHRDNKNYLKWNLENMATLLNNNFPKSHIVVVRPSRMEFKTFSCYDNFVPSNNAGVPDHTPTHSALHHLERVLQGVTHRLKAMPISELLEAMSAFSNQDSDMDIDVLQDTDLHTPSGSIFHSTMTSCGSLVADTDSDNDGEPKVEVSDTEISFSCQPGVIQSTHCQSAIVANPQATPLDTPLDIRCTQKIDTTKNPLWWRDTLALDKAQLTLVGFSKGCVVLNQLIYEFHYLKTLTPDDVTMLRFVSRITNMYWLDGGHAGGKNAWITSRSLLETLARLGIHIFIHVSPYQVRDERRPWIGREERAFTALLRRLGAPVTRYFHQDVGPGAGGHAQPTLKTHFQLLSLFRLQDLLGSMLFYLYLI